MQRPARRARPTLLILVWIWALCVFTIVDLFWNVDEFDRIRPRSTMYRAARHTAHELVGEPDLDGDFGDAPTGMRPRSDTELLRAMASKRGPLALVGIVRNPDEREDLRIEAARLVGETGALAALDDLIESELPESVRAGAVHGLSAIGTGAALERALLLTAQPPPALRVAAVQAIAGFESPEVVPALAKVAHDEGATLAVRVAACRAMGRAGARDALKVAALSDKTCVAVRVAAVSELEKMDPIHAYAALKAVSGVSSKIVSRRAWMARARAEQRIAERHG